MSKKTFKPMPKPTPKEEIEAVEAQYKAVESKPDNPIVKKLLTIDGISLEQAEHMAEHGVVDDVYTVQTFYRISGQAAEAVIKVFKEKAK